jgi:C4-dicarboxylate-specific signal transduction histidine kinase
MATRSSKLKQSILNLPGTRTLRLLPLLILALGLLATAMFIGTTRINERQLRNFETANALMDIQMLTTTSHLWLEESLSGDTEVDIDDVWADINLAITLGEALLQGGKSEHGLEIHPLKEQQLRLRLELVNELLNRYKIGVHKKRQQNSIGFLGLDQDEQFDAIYRDIQREAAKLEAIVEKNQLVIQTKSRQLFAGILFAWAVILGAAAWGLWRHAERRLAMEASLKSANSQLNIQTEELVEHRRHLQELVDARTIELTTQNRQLHKEIAERKKFTEALSDSQKRSNKLFSQFNALAKAISDPIVLLSPELNVLWTNNIRGPCSDERLATIRGKKCYSLSLGKLHVCDGCAVVECFSSGLEETGHTMTADGKIWEIKAYPVKNEASQVTSVLALATDVTEKLKLQAETIRTAHLASLGEMAAGVAHEINNPINGVINYAQMLIDDRKTAQEDYDIQNRILKEGRRIARIVKSLLSFAREGKEAREYVSIQAILTETLTLSAAQLRKDGITLGLDVALELPPVFAHFQQIEQVFLNLINNARYALNQKYRTGNENKVLAISAEAIRKDGSPFVKITFFDQGIGIPAEIIHKIFNPFFSTKPKGVGTGLGLSISHGIVTDHGGEITIDSCEGNSTRIDILLPAGVKNEQTDPDNR